MRDRPVTGSRPLPRLVLISAGFVIVVCSIAAGTMREWRLRRRGEDTWTPR